MSGGVGGSRRAITVTRPDLSLCPSGTIFRLLSLRSFLLRRRRETTADRPRPIAQRCGDSCAAGPGPYVDAHGLKPGESLGYVFMTLPPSSFGGQVGPYSKSLAVCRARHAFR
jgi:hypothetical protein